MRGRAQNTERGNVRGSISRARRTVLTPGDENPCVFLMTINPSPPLQDLACALLHAKRYENVWFQRSSPPMELLERKHQNLWFSEIRSALKKYIHVARPLKIWNAILVHFGRPYFCGVSKTRTALEEYAFSTKA